MKFYLLVSVLLSAAAVSMGKSSPADEIPKLTPSDLAQGKKIFVGQCALCHGIGGAGGRGPALNKPDLPRAADNQALFNIIKNGIPQTKMPEAWQRTDHEIWQVAGYVRSLRRTAVSKLPGDPAKGREIYDSKGACAACHIISGRGGSSVPRSVRLELDAAPPICAKP